MRNNNIIIPGTNGAQVIPLVRGQKHQVEIRAKNGQKVDTVQRVIGRVDSHSPWFITYNMKQYAVEVDTNKVLFATLAI